MQEVPTCSVVGRLAARDWADVHEGMFEPLFEAAARDATLNALAPFKTASGGYKFGTKARYKVVEK